MVTPSSATRASNVASVARMDGERQALVRLLVGGPASLDQQRRDGIGGHLVELVDGPHRGRDVRDAEAPVEALDEFAVVDLQAQRRQEVQSSQRLGHDPGDLDVVVEPGGRCGDDVDVGLRELAVAALLRSLAAPRLLDLVAAERELEVPGVLQHVARERHGEVEVQPEAGVVVAVVGLQPAQDVDLLVDLALRTAVRAARRRGVSIGREPVQLEDCAQPVEHGAFDKRCAGQQLGESGQRHQVRSCRNGLVARSRAIVVAGP